MSQATPSACACPTPITTEVPGSAGTPGTNGTNGYNAFSILQSSFIVPAVGSNVTVSVDQAQWMVPGQNVNAQGAGTFQVASVVAGSPATVVTLTYLNYVDNTNSGNTVPAGSQISPDGYQPSLSFPISIADGGTNATTQAAAQVNLGLGQNATVLNASGLSLSMPTTPTEITGVTVTVPATGLYEISAFATVDMVGITIGTSAEVITLTPLPAPQ
jgi:hypothetical protein